MWRIVEQIRMGGDRNFGYLVGDRDAGVAVAVDPSYDPALIHDRATSQGLRITHVLNTHGHDDHVNGNDEMVRLTGAKTAAHASSSIRPDVELEEGGVVEVGALTLRVLHVPGHTMDHVVYYVPELGVALTGDHLFVGKIGGTATEAEARAEYDSLARMLEQLPDETTIWPGHDYGCRPSSTIALEKETNPFLQVPDLPAFLDLKRRWAGFKADHGLV